MERMFSGCSSISFIDVTNFNTSNVKNMFDTFAYCSKLISVNVSKFDTSKVTTMQGMFIQCTNLKYLDLSNFDTSSLKSAYKMFEKNYFINIFKFKFFQISKFSIQWWNVFFNFW